MPKYKLQRKPIVKEIQIYIYIFICLWYWCWKVLLFFLCRLNFPYQHLLIFLSFTNTFLKSNETVIPRGVNLNYVLIFFPSQHDLQTSFDVYKVKLVFFIYNLMHWFIIKLKKTNFGPLIHKPYCKIFPYFQTFSICVNFKPLWCCHSCKKLKNFHGWTFDNNWKNLGPLLVRKPF